MSKGLDGFHLHVVGAGVERGLCEPRECTLDYNCFAIRECKEALVWPFGMISQRMDTKLRGYNDLALNAYSQQ